MKVEFDINTCGNFNIAANKIWMEPNLQGGYASSTIYGLNNKRYHGLFVIPVGKNAKKTIILSKFEESIFIGKQVYELSTNQFSGGIYPDGFQYLKSFSIDPFPKFLYEIDGRRVEKTLFMLHDQHTLVIRYSYKNQGPTLNLVMKPMIAGRELSDLSHEVATINTDSYLEAGVVKLAPKETVPELKIYYKKGEYVPAPLWYHNFLYDKDFRRKQNHNNEITEDLYNPGFFTCSLEAYQTFELYLSVDELHNLEYETIYKKEKEYRRTFDQSFSNAPLNVKDISKIVETLTQNTVGDIPVHVKSYPISDPNTREMLYSLKGLALFEKNKNIVKETLLKYVEIMQEGLLPAKINPEHENEKKIPADVNLIFIDVIYYIYELKIHRKFIEENLIDVLHNIIEVYTKGIPPHILQDDVGLITSGTESISTSWINENPAKNAGIRYGKLCEINALWYNALKIMEYISAEMKKSKLAQNYAVMAEKTKTAFMSTFWDKKNSRCYDLVRSNHKDSTFTISQIYLLALPFSMFDKDQGLKVLNQIEDRLLTPFGLRSLSPRDRNYIGRIGEPKNNIDEALYSGSIWPWTIGMYVDAVLQFRGNTQETKDQMLTAINTLSDFFYRQGMGHISEYFEGDAPYRRFGQICNGLNLSELLRCYFLISNPNDIKSIN
jgi:predicted glycogen debranching enzyme